MLQYLFLGFILPFFLSASIVYFWQFFLRKKEILDHPNHRSSHDIPTPRGGGIGIFLGFWISAFLFYYLVWWNHSFDGYSFSDFIKGKNEFFHFILLAVASGILFLAGLWDDFSSTRRRIRLSIQIIVALLLIIDQKDSIRLAIDSWLFTSHFDFQIYKLKFAIYGIAGFLLILGIVWTINLYNFMDGINGIAALQSIFLSIAFSYFIYYSNSYSSFLGLPLLIILTSSTFGFLIWNFPKALVFLGDGGSNFLGFMIVAIGLHSVLEGYLSFWSGLVLSSLFWMDASATILLRWLRKENIAEAHRSHLYQILSQRWKSHTKVSLLYTMINLFLLFPLAVCMQFYPQWQIAIFIIVSVTFLLFYFKLISNNSNNAKFNSNLKC
jgi:Fuc2NAc and GlcNAc transferase